MNLHPVTLLFILILAAFFYSQGFLFFFFATLAIGFLLLIASLTSASAASGSHHGGGDAQSVYPEKMTIKVEGEVPPAFGGEKEFAKDVVGGAGVVGRALKSIWNFNIQDKPKKKDDDGEKKTNGGHGGH